MTELANLPPRLERLLDRHAVHAGVPFDLKNTYAARGSVAAPPLKPIRRPHRIALRDPLEIRGQGQRVDADGDAFVTAESASNAGRP